MACKSYTPLPVGASPYQLQVAGHTMLGSSIYPMLKHPTQPVIFKLLQDNARGYREVAFYEKVYESNAPEALCLLRPFVPKYYGIYRCPQSQALYIGLSDKLATFLRPNVCDIKLGTVGYRPETDLEKKLREESKYAWRKELGFMFSGMQIYDSKTESYVKFSRQFCRTIAPQEIYGKALLTLLGPDPARRMHLARAYHLKLMDLLSWFEHHGSHTLTFCRSSLLLGHDTAVPSTEVVTCLIDFTDWSTAEEDTSDVLTNGFAHGLSVLIGLMRCVIQSSVDELASVAT